MSDDRGPARLAKWPFYLADVLLCAVIFFVLNRLGTFEGTAETVIVVVCLAAAGIAAWISITPWLKEHDAAVHLSDSSNLKSSLEQIKGVDKVADLIRQSNVQWQGVQEASARTVNSAKEISERMKVEADEFMKFISNAHDQERAGLRLEVEKLRRMEGDWIKTSVQMLDHVFALTRAAERSGQLQLIKQLQQFQGACRDVARRMGLATFVPAVGEPFDQRAHQLPNPQLTAQEGDRVHDVLACGFTYQGQLLRRSLVMLDSTQSAEEPVTKSEEQEVAGETPPAVEQPASNEPILKSEKASDEAPSEEAPAIIDSLSTEGAREPIEAAVTDADIDEMERFEEPPPVIDSYGREQQQMTETPLEGALPSTEEQSKAGKGKKSTAQEELPF